jgi:hypothetical protein
MRQIGIAFMMYAGENKGLFPMGSRWDVAFREDWLWWQQTAPTAGPAGDGTPRNTLGVQESAIGKFLGIRNNQPEILTCPSDNAQQRAESQIGGKYLFSYAMNQYFESNKNRNPAKPQIPRLGNFKNSTAKILLAEEDFSSINDGLYAPPMSQQDGVTQASGGNDLLSIRHDATKMR